MIGPRRCAPDEVSTAPACPHCYGEVYHLGTLGSRDHFRCRDCGSEFSVRGWIGDDYVGVQEVA